MPRNPLYDIAFYVPSPFDFNLVGEGQLTSLTFDAGEADFNLEGRGDWARALLFDGDLGSFGLSLSGEFLFSGKHRNWVKWSKIAHFDFTIDRSNIAGEAPIEGIGDIYSIGKIASTIMVYGSGGIARLEPRDNVFAKVGVYKVGAMSKGAILITEHFHLIIDSSGCLWKMSEGMQRLGYEEYLSALVNPVISYDIVSDLAFICDGTLGFTFHCVQHSMGEGPVNVTGIGYREGESYVLTSLGLALPKMYLTSSHLDFGLRKGKMIREVEVGTDIDADLELGIEFRNFNRENFTGPVWFSVTPEGRAFPNVSSKEFKFSLRGNADESQKINYIKFKGHIPDFTATDL